MKNIIACVDFSEATSEVLDLTCTLATALRARVHLLHAVVIRDSLSALEGGVVIPEEMVTKAMHRAREQLNDLREPLLENGLDVTTILLEEHWNAAKAILDEAKKHEADMIVMGSHGHGAMYRLLVGSTANDVIHKAKCPVLLVPTRPMEESSKGGKPAAAAKKGKGKAGKG